MVLNLYRGIQQAKDALPTCHDRLKSVVAATQVANRFEKSIDIKDKSNQHPRGDGRSCAKIFSQYGSSPSPDNQSCSQASQQLDDRGEGSGDAGSAQVGVQVVVIDFLAEVLEVDLLAAESLHHANAVDIFCQHRVHPTYRRSYLAVVLTGALAKDDRDKHHEREYAGGEQS